MLSGVLGPDGGDRLPDGGLVRLPTALHEALRTAAAAVEALVERDAHGAQKVVGDGADVAHDAGLGLGHDDDE